MYRDKHLQNTYIIPHPWLANYGLWTKSGPPLFWRKVLLELSHPHLFIYWLGLLSLYTGRVGDRTESVCPENQKYILSSLLKKKFADLCSILKL